MARTFVMGDKHGAHKALVQCLERSKFDKKEDTLIDLGDICDGWSEVDKCVDELLSIDNLIPIKGNHDDWFWQWIMTGVHPVKWKQGGDGTLRSYCKRFGKNIQITSAGYETDLNPSDIPEIHRRFFYLQHLKYIDDEYRCFVHGGFNRHLSIEAQEPWILYWDRDLWYSAMSFAATTRGDKDKATPRVIKTIDKFKEIYIGHTATTAWDKDTPMQAGNIWNLDTGAGFKGRLTIMDVDTKEFWQSDRVEELYKDEKGRN